MGDLPTSVCVALAGLAAFLFLRWRLDPLNAIPTVGGTSVPILSCLGTYRYLKDGRKVLSEGYQRFYGSVFKIALPNQWLVIISGPEMVEDVRRRGGEEASFRESFDDFFNIKYTTGRYPIDDGYHIDVIRERLMRGITAVLPDMVDELLLAIPTYIDPPNDSWKELNAFHVMERIIARASSRVFVGEPLCRDEGYLDLAIQYTTAVVTDGYILSLFPTIFRPIVGRLTSNAKNTVRNTFPYLNPYINERREKMKDIGNEWTEKPNDMLQWIIDEEIARGGANEVIAERVMIVNFASIHTTSNSAIQALFHLAVSQAHVLELREEIEPIVATEGWTKNSIGKMWKLDSVLKESQRHNGVSLLSLSRKVMKDITLANGTFLPKGTLIAAAARPIHYDSAHYSQPDAFQPFRFADLREEGEGSKHQFTNTSADYLPFGHGQYACPGRFFAASELKVLLAFIIINYDFKLAGDRMERPDNIYFLDAVIPDPTARLLFKRR